ncbi:MULTISPECIES: hypothetical protein [Streptomyces]|uniref:Uncharacterized protein n=1 Tax=Streptomyces koelreuteriae TaxID=2838015 RepID=A0ABX8G5Z8_9ACTN|nr:MULTISPECIES: hypothetical protein [Streptomyces]QWB28602.1 hypothetical protein KJK29_07725 [Streptomyces koelreuteriae]UUA11574.1 hypothetical protein NNW98_07765 [Streptomyces koelreuteriae]UUA19172.1 hypothetical protein NNW99_07765 [Streptomyces sp. CRCS-T-1]
MADASATGTQPCNPYRSGSAPADSTERSSVPSSLRTYTAASATPANARTRSRAAGSGAGRGGPVPPFPGARRPGTAARASP